MDGHLFHGAEPTVLAFQQMVYRRTPSALRKSGQDAATKLVELKGITSQYQQATFVEKSGAAMMPGGDKPLKGVSQACAELLVQATK